jgi:hypothetical protein
MYHGFKAEGFTRYTKHSHALKWYFTRVLASQHIPIAEGSNFGESLSGYMNSKGIDSEDKMALANWQDFAVNYAAQFGLNNGHAQIIRKQVEEIINAQLENIALESQTQSGIETIVDNHKAETKAESAPDVAPRDRNYHLPLALMGLLNN